MKKLIVCLVALMSGIACASAQAPGANLTTQKELVEFVLNPYGCERLFWNYPLQQLASKASERFEITGNDNEWIHFADHQYFKVADKNICPRYIQGGGEISWHFAYRIPGGYADGLKIAERLTRALRDYGIKENPAFAGIYYATFEFKGFLIFICVYPNIPDQLEIYWSKQK